MTSVRALTAAALFLVAAATIPQARQDRELEPELRARLDAFTAALRTGDLDAFEAMAQAHFAPALLAARTPAERRRMQERIRTEFGALTVTSVSVINGVATVAVRGATGMAGRFELTLEPAPSFRIARLGVELGGGDDEMRGAPAIELAPSMAAPDMGRVLDAWMAPRVADDTFAGVVLIARDGVPVITRAYGLADRERRVDAASDLRYNLGSINKLFTKVAIGQLLAAGKLALTDTVGALLPDYPDSPARGATVEQLLEHQGGIADFFGPAFDAAPKSQFRRNADYYRFVAAQPVRFAPGARREYCNGCYIVLGAIVERVSGLPYETYVAQKVYAPAGMSGAGWFAQDALPAKVAKGYTRRAGPGKPEVPLHENGEMHGATGSAAGGGYASAADLLAFDSALRTGKLLDPAKTAWMLQTDRAEPGRARGGIGAAGGAPGINAALESDGVWTIVVLANLDPPAATSVALAIRKALIR
jgi:CubicO group peptidase (beta-lactamase class C family)